MIDKCCFQRQIARTVDSFFLRRLIRCFRNSKQICFRETLFNLNTVIIITSVSTKFGIVTFVEKQFAANFLDDNVPAVVGTDTAHQGGENGISSIHVAFSLGQLKFCDILLNSFTKSETNIKLTLRIMGSSVVVTLWKMRSILCSLRSFFTVTRSYCLS